MYLVNRHRLVTFLLFIVLSGAHAAEQSLDLEQEVPAAPAVSSVSSTINKFSFMGRVDLTTESTNPDRPKAREHHLDNNHFLFFIKAKASPKVSFMGELVKQSFYFVDYLVRPDLTVEFGKIIVPFGDTRHFHHFYGGVQGYGAKGVMFANIWAESGANLKWQLAQSELETYWVDSIQDDSLTADPGLQSTVEPRTIQAGGFRWKTEVISALSGVLSGYRGEYQPGKAVEIAGLDLFADYGFWGLKHFRWSYGVANAWMRKSPVSGDFIKRGDYLELATNLIGSGEARVRYGTYIDNDKVRSKNDVQSLNIGYSLPVDVLRVLAEYQWNYEAVNEIDNDLLRVMVSLDF